MSAFQTATEKPESVSVNVTLSELMMAQALIWKGLNVI